MNGSRGDGPDKSNKCGGGLLRSTLVHVIDDDPGICDAMQMLLSTVGFESRTYGSASEFLEQAESFDGGCVVADVRMPGTSGIELVEKLKQVSGAPPVILMTGDSDVTLVIQAMRAGAVDFLEKPFSPDDMIAAVLLALAGEEQEGARREAFIALLNTLNNTEKEVLNRVIGGKTSKTIALELGMGLRAVEIHRAGGMSKMNVRNLPELLRMAFIAGRDAFPGLVQS